MAAPKLTVYGLNKNFATLLALSDINLAIADGEFISIVGPSGCGKTTFLRIVAGLESASAGEVRIDGDIVKKPGIDRGFVFQSDNLLPWRTTMDNVLFPLEVQNRLGVNLTITEMEPVVRVADLLDVLEARLSRPLFRAA